MKCASDSDRCVKVKKSENRLRSEKLNVEFLVLKQSVRSIGRLDDQGLIQIPIFTCWDPHVAMVTQEIHVYILIDNFPYTFF